MPKYSINEAQLNERIRALEYEVKYLRSTENLYQNLFNNLIDEVHIWELIRNQDNSIKTWRLVDANSAALKVWAKEKHEIIGKTTDEIFPNVNATQTFKPIVDKIFTENKPYIWESYFEGTQQTLFMKSIPMGNYFISTGVDISELKKTQADLDESNLRLRESVKAANVGIFDWNFLTDTLFWDEQMYHIYGHPPSKSLNTVSLWENALHPDDKEQATKSLTKAIATGENYDMEFRIIRPNGQVRFIKANATILSNEQGEPTRIVGTNLDISKTKHSELLIESLKKRNEALLDHSPVSHKIIDLKNNLTYMNKNGYQMLKLPLDNSWSNKAFPFDFFPRTCKELINKQLKLVKSNKKRLTFETPALNFIGEEIWLLLTIEPIFKEDESLDFISVVTADITERKHQEKLILNTQKVALAGQLSAGICHDLNNVLNIVSGNAELLERSLDKSKQKNYAQKIMEGITRAKNVTDRLLTLARPKCENVTEFNINHIIESELKFYREALPNHIKFESHLNIDATIKADLNTFTDSLINLVVNAQKAIEGHGKITITNSLHHQFDPKSDFVFCPPEYAMQYCCVSVKDNGIGIASESLDKIFNPFYTQREASQGSGLGLSVVSAFAVNNHCGLTVNSIVGQGSEFRLWLPIVSTSANTIAAKNVTKNYNIANKTIVLIDDELELLDIFSESLQLLGANVIKFDNPLLAKQYISTHSCKIDILLTDQSLGDKITGNEIVEWVNQHFITISCYILTGYSADEKLSNVNAKILEKPISIDNLIKELIN
ncbi:PAS domain-containing protein [Thalassotalea ganghwensis]